MELDLEGSDIRAMNLPMDYFQVKSQSAFKVILTNLLAISALVAISAADASPVQLSPTSAKPQRASKLQPTESPNSDSLPADQSSSIEDASTNKANSQPTRPTASAAASTTASATSESHNALAAKHAFEEAILSNLAADHYDLARHYMHKCEWEMSEIELEAAIMFMPTMKAAHRDYCLVSLIRGQGLRSLAEMMMVVGLGDPIPLTDNEKTELTKKAARLHYQKGLNYGIVRQWKKATPEFLWALTYAPKSAAIAHSLAFSYAAAGDFENAEKQYLKAFALDPNNSYSHADFAVLLAEHGDQ